MAPGDVTRLIGEHLIARPAHHHLHEPVAQRSIRFADTRQGLSHAFGLEMVCAQARAAAQACAALAAGEEYITRNW